MEQRATEAVARWAEEGWTRSGRPCVVAFWCNAGEHRSVCAAEAFARAWGGRAVHLCADNWHWRSCGSCPQCNPDNPDPRREAAWEKFKQWMLAARAGRR